jgi:murein DD-endopeptidase MepM/ murein hydrolase activator NlpD
MLPIHLIYMFAFVITACSTPTPVPTLTTQPSETPKLSATATITPSPAPPTPTLSPTEPLPTATPGPIVCSPLEGIAIAELPDLIHNPYAPPRLGSDDAHQGVDFADLDPVYEIALEGRPVQAAMPGHVASIIDDRFPYGYAIIVETPLNQVLPEWTANLQIPTLAPTQGSHPSLTCPELENSPNWDFSSRSIYLMYAHLKEPFALQTGDQITLARY